MTRRSRHVRILIGAVLIALGLGLALAWHLTRTHNAWKDRAPLYTSVHMGNLMLHSSIWKPGRDGNMAWRSDAWMYDVWFRAFPAWRPGYGRIGQAYSGSPPYVANMSSLSIPLWNLGVLPIVVGAWLIRRAAGAFEPGHCQRCGYSRWALASDAPCPECGSIDAGRSTPQSTPKQTAE